MRRPYWSIISQTACIPLTYHHRTIWDKCKLVKLLYPPVHLWFHARWPHRHLSTAHTPNAVPATTTTVSQAGGTLQLSFTGRSGGRVLQTGSDPVGRWCFQILNSYSNQCIIFITAYCECQNQRTGPQTAYKHQCSHLANSPKSGKNTSPPRSNAPSPPSIYSVPHHWLSQSSPNVGLRFLLQQLWYYPIPPTMLSYQSS